METVIPNDNQILKAIAAGKYRHCYLVYARKSTDEPDNQKNSIKYQRAENMKFATRERLPIAPITLNGFCLNGIISERHSGFKEDTEISISNAGMVQYRIERPKFHRLLQFLSKGLFKGAVVLCWDRVSRNRGDDTVVRKLMKNGVDVRFVYANYENSSAGALHMDIDGMFAEHHSRVTAEKVRLTTRNLRDRGICTYKAPIGYLNAGTMESKPLDPVRAPIIKRMFELLATDEWSLSDLAKWANEQGLTTVPARRRRTAEEMLAEEEDEVQIEAVARPMTVTMIHKILTNPFYSGRIRGNDGQYVLSASHQALVSEELFAHGQKVLAKKRTSVHYAETVELPWRGFIRCTDCGRVYTPYMKKGIQYFNARCPQDCINPCKNLKLSFLEGEIGKRLSRLTFTDDELAEIDARAKTDISLLEERRHKELDNLERRKKKLREDLGYLRANKLALLRSDVYSPEGFLEEERVLNAELENIQQSEQSSDASMHEVIKDLVKLSELLKTRSSLYHLANSAEKERIIRIVFSELSLSGKTLTHQCKPGFKALETRFRFVCDQTGWLSELFECRAGITAATDELSCMIPMK